MTTPVPPYVQVAGMRVPITLVPRIVTAFRGLYPTVTEGLDDDSAVRAVLRYWTKRALADWEAQVAGAPVVDAVEQARTTYAAKAAEARARAEEDALAIVDAAVS